MSLLSAFLAGLSPEDRAVITGKDTTDPLHQAFTAKRVVHAGNPGIPLSAEEARRRWQAVMETPLAAPAHQLAYIHIPFCQTKCLYCGFFQNQSEQAAEDRYIDHLIQELEMASDAPRFQSSAIDAVFIGGGTPTSLSPENARRLLSAIQKYLPLSSGCEITLEGRVHDVVPEKIEAWAEGGVNRVSLGVQSFHTKIRRQIGRIDDEETVLRRIAALKETCRFVVIADLIYGLPDQTMDLWMEDLDLLWKSGADGMDLYQLNVFEGSELDRRIKSGRLSPAASTEMQADMYLAAAEWVEKRPFQQMNMRHWRRSPLERSLYNIMVKEGVPLYPFGSGAGGHAGGYALMLHRALSPYEAMVDAGEKPIMGMTRQDPSQPMVDEVLRQLEQGYFDPAEAAKKDPRLADLKELCQIWQDRGLAAWNGVLYRLTKAGEFWQVNLAQSAAECVKVLSGGTPQIIREKVAAQNGKDESGPSPLVRAIMRMADADEKTARAMAGRIPPHVRSMLEAMPPAMIEMAAKSLGSDTLRSMMEKAKAANPQAPNRD